MSSPGLGCEWYRWGKVPLLLGDEKQPAPYLVIFLGTTPNVCAARHPHLPLATLVGALQGLGRLSGIFSHH
jgi:hypothetical protein